MEAPISAPIKLGVSSSPLMLRYIVLPFLGGGELTERRSGAGEPPKVSHSRGRAMLTPLKRSAAAGLVMCSIVSSPPPTGHGVSKHGKA